MFVLESRATTAFLVARRYIALHPTLPNGLKDVFTDKGELPMSNPRAGGKFRVSPALWEIELICS